MQTAGTMTAKRGDGAMPTCHSEQKNTMQAGDDFLKFMEAEDARK